MKLASKAIKAAQAYQLLQNNVHAAGLGYVDVGEDWEVFEQICGGTKKGIVGEHFTRMINTTPPDDGFWITLEDSGGGVIASVAARLQRTGSWTLRQFWSQYIPRAYVDAEGCPVQLEAGQAVFADKITGDVAYIGEGWVDEAWGGRGLSITLVRMALVLAMSMWSPAYLYGWMRPRHALRGTSIKWGFTECHPSALQFVRPPRGDDLSELYFVGTSACAALDLIARLAAEYRANASNTGSELCRSAETMAATGGRS